MKRWYALYTKPNAEYQVATALQRQALEIYLPEIKDPKSSQGRQSIPFFPCYLFLKVDFEAVGLSQVQWIPGLRRVLTFGDQPAPVSNTVIDLIQHKLGEIKANGDRPIHTFKPGDTVRITDGPFQDILAIFEGSTTPSQRVQVLLNILGHPSRMQINVTDLEKAALDAETPAPGYLRRTRGRGRHFKQTAE
ncbi:MAG: transcription termination/antitermination NusG family protein [Anaerolineae bacterium]